MVYYSDMLCIVLDFIISVVNVNWYSMILGVIVFVLFFGFGCWGCILVMLVVIVLVIVVGYWIDWYSYGIVVVGYIDL